MNEALYGKWEMIRAHVDGEESPHLLALGVQIELKDDTYIVHFGDTVADKGTLSLGLTGSLTLSSTEGPNRGRTIPCIYQLAGDRLRVCYGIGGAAPTEFSTTAGSGRYLAIYRRKVT